MNPIVKKRVLDKLKRDLLSKNKRSNMALDRMRKHVLVKAKLAEYLGCNIADLEMALEIIREEKLKFYGY